MWYLKTAETMKQNKWQAIEPALILSKQRPCSLKKIIIILNEMAFLWKENTSCSNILINFLCLPKTSIVMITKHPQQSSTGVSQNVPWYILLSETGHLLVSDVCVSIYISRPHATVHAYMYILIMIRIF